MKIDLKEACLLAGISHRHGVCFQSVASYIDSVIACRSVGKAVTGLLEESYSSKPFHVKAKTCDWGPMAGFVTSDPRLERRNSDVFKSQTSENYSVQRRGSHNSIANGQVGQIPIVISEARKNWLVEKGYIDIGLDLVGGGIALSVSANSPASGNHSQFILRRDAKQSGLWGLYYAPSTSGMPSIAGSSSDAMRRGSFARDMRGSLNQLEPVFALADPIRSAYDYRAAFTGDYDLWAVFPKKTEGRPAREQGFPVHNRGSMTHATITAMQSLNCMFRVLGGYQGGDLIHHGAEMHRPGVSSVEMNFIAFVPDRNQACFVRNMADFSRFYLDIGGNYQTDLNPGWYRQLGIQQTRSGNWTA
jgi:hypothetical protein